MANSTDSIEVTEHEETMAKLYAELFKDHEIIGAMRMKISIISMLDEHRGEFYPLIVSKIISLILSLDSGV